MGLRAPAEAQTRLLDVLALDTEEIVINRTIVDAHAALVALDTDEEYQRLVREAEDWADRHDEIERQCEHLESDIRAAKSRIAQDREREKGSTDSKELTSLEHEIESLERRIEMLEDQELAALAERDEVTGTWNAIKIARDSFHDARADAQDALRSDIAASNRRLADIVTARAEIVASLPTDLIELYERQRERYGVGDHRLPIERKAEA